MEEKIISFLKSLSVPEETYERLESRMGWDAERSFGNADDVFSDGQESAIASVALACRDYLKENFGIEVKKD